MILLIGAPIGGVLFASVGMSGTALVNAATFAVMLAVLAAVRPGVPTPPPAGAKRSIVGEAADGVRVAVRHPLLRPGLLLTAVVAAAAIPVPTSIVRCSRGPTVWRPTRPG